MIPPQGKVRRDPLLEAADALESGHLTHEQLRIMFSPVAKAMAQQHDLDLGPLAAAGLGAARGMSFGLSDLAQHIALNPAETQAVATTATQHPYAATAGTLAGGALPFLFTGGASGATLPALGVRGTRVALGAAQGAGLTPGGVTDRAVGAGAGGLLAGYGPEIAAGAGRVAQRVPIVGGMARRMAGIQPGFPTALKAVPPAPVAPVDWRIAALRERLKGAPESAIQQAIAGLDAPSGVAPSTPAQAAPDALRNLPDAALSPTPSLMESAAAPGAQEAILARQGLLGNAPQAAPPGLLSPQVVANSYNDLRQFLRQGIPQERITINYWTRGGKLEQAVPPVPKGGLRGATLQQLSQSLQTPGIPQALRQAIEREVLSRGYQLAP